MFDAAFSALRRFPDDGLRASCLALYINACLLFCEDSKFYEAGKVQLLSAMPEHLALPELSSTLLYRLLVLLGSLLYEDDNTRELAQALEVQPAVEAAVAKYPNDRQLQKVGKEVLQVIKGGS